LVLETLTKKQTLTVWRATQFEASLVRKGLPFRSRSRIPPSSVTSVECPPSHHPTYTSGSSESRISPGDHAHAKVQTEEDRPYGEPGSDSEGPE
jgi:hypothetical protein